MCCVLCVCVVCVFVVCVVCVVCVFVCVYVFAFPPEYVCVGGNHVDTFVGPAYMHAYFDLSHGHLSYI